MLDRFLKIDYSKRWIEAEIKADEEVEFLIYNN